MVTTKALKIYVPNGSENKLTNICILWLPIFQIYLTTKCLFQHLYYVMTQVARLIYVKR